MVDIGSAFSPFVSLQARLGKDTLVPKLFLKEQRDLLLLGIKNPYIMMAAWYDDNADHTHASVANVSLMMKVPIYAMTFFGWELPLDIAYAGLAD